MYALDWTAKTRNFVPHLIWFLPFAGFLIGWVYFKWGQESNQGSHLIIDEINNPKKRIPLILAPLVFAGTILTHFFGGSAGREGTAVQMGAALSDQISRFNKIDKEDRSLLLAAGASAGFSAAIGTPWAGAVFGMEMLRIGRIRFFAVCECVIASFVGYYTAIVLQAPHVPFEPIGIPKLEFSLPISIFVAGLTFGLTAKLFTHVTHFIENLCQKYISYPPLRPFVGGLLLALMFFAEGSSRYESLGLSVINEALTTVSSFLDPLLKFGFTSLTIGSGFKGGEFIPLVFIGSTLGSALSTIIPVSSHLLAGLGFAAVFAGASNTPIACSLMAIEIFGLEIAPYALIACFASYWVSGNKSIYKTQIVHNKKYIDF